MCEMYVYLSAVYVVSLPRCVFITISFLGPCAYLSIFPLSISSQQSSVARVADFTKSAKYQQ